jgi:hypothetical protein
MQLYNYDYDDMREITMSLNDKDGIHCQSKIYPTKLEVKIDKDINRPYLYYEGIMRTNKGFLKIEFPRLDLVLDTISYEKQYRENMYLPWYPKTISDITIKDYKMTTEFHNLNDEKVMFYLKRLDAEEHKDITDQFWNGVKIVGEDTNSEN